MNKNGDDACRKCGRKFSGRDYSVQCDGECSGWFHKKCTELSNEDVKAVEKGKRRFVCETCKSKVMPEVSANINIIDENLQSNQKKNIPEIMNKITIGLSRKNEGMDRLDINDIKFIKIAEMIGKLYQLIETQSEEIKLLRQEIMNKNTVKNGKTVKSVEIDKKKTYSESVITKKNV
ncbi:hypothetical protein WA026_014269, partial [Henosepilachna vigintioctopunctata]